MLQIRYGVFESNSSSVHSLIVAQNDEIDKLDTGELLINTGWNQYESFISYEDAVKELIEYINKYHGEYDEEARSAVERGDKEVIYDYLREYDIAEPLDRYLDSEYLEPYEERFTTPKGDRVLVFGRFGMS